MIQFPLRALFVLTLLAAILAAVARWFVGLNNSASIFAVLSIGFFIGITTVLILQNVEITCFLVVSLIGFAVAGFWFSGRYISYTLGTVLGATVAFKGIAVLNAVFHFCGITISSDRGDSRSGPHD